LDPQDQSGRVPPPQANNPLHGITLQIMLEALVAHYGWPGLAERISLRCFAQNPSMASSLKVIRKTPWAREKVESLYLFMLREARRARKPTSAESTKA
jgi:uncharacterized protein (DUF2132 family)